jgi:gluconolactonase
LWSEDVHHCLMTDCRFASPNALPNKAAILIVTVEEIGMPERNPDTHPAPWAGASMARSYIAPSLPPACAVDLMTDAGSAVFGAVWRTMEAKVVEVPAIPDALPEYKTTYDIAPHAGEAGFDDSGWPVIAPVDLAAKRGGGRVSFIWYRTRLTMPAEIGGFATAGTIAVLTANIDDYAEIWVNGELPRSAGRPSPALIQGFNMPNRLVLTQSANTGDTFDIAAFGINGPISAAPPNTVWFREAKVEFYR